MVAMATKRTVLNNPWLVFVFLLRTLLIKMVMCFVPDCKHYSESHTCQFLRFPKDDKEKKTWIENIGYI